MKRLDAFIVLALFFGIGLQGIGTPAPSHEKGTVAPLIQSQIPRDESGSVLGASTTRLTVGNLDPVQGFFGTAQMRIPLQVRPLPKSVYSSGEDVVLTVANPDNEPFTTTVTDPTGSTVSLPITESNDGTTTTVKIAGSNEMRPGKYSVAITDQEGNTTSQDFDWGVLALNFDKSVYVTSDTAKISLGVLDDTGNVVCNASIILRITNEDLGVDDTLSTDTNTITQNPDCQDHDFSLKPDYAATYQFTKPGAYQVLLTATTESGPKTLTDTIQVGDQTPFDIQRDSSMRISSGDLYSMKLKIKTDQDFSGTVTETVPDSFVITPNTDPGVTSYDSMQTVYIDPTADPNSSLQALLGGANRLVMPFHGNYSVTQGFGAPLTDPTLQSLYTQYGLAGHDGIDFAMPDGTPLYAVDDGNVVFTGQDYGTTVVIQHSWGKTYYGHLSNVSVSMAEHVVKGQLIGYSGESGEATGPHLHFGMKTNNPDTNNGYEGKIDPMLYLPFDTESSSSASVDTVQPVLGAATEAASQEFTPNVSASSAADISSSAALDNFTALTGQINLDEMLANSAQTEKVKTIIWHITLKSGATTTLGYDYQLPKTSSDIAQIGPVRLYSSDSDTVIFQEKRSWQLASDDIGSQWLSQWPSRRKITIDHTQVSGTNELTNFPVLITLPQHIAQQNMAFTAADGVTPLEFEQDQSDPTGEKVWVQVPQLSPAEDTTEYLYYGDPNTPSNQGTVSQDSTAWTMDWIMTNYHNQTDPDFLNIGPAEVLQDNVNASGSASFSTDGKVPFSF